VSQRKHRTMTFEQILAQARSVRSSLGTEDRPPTVLVERMGRLKAIVSLPIARKHSTWSSKLASASQHRP
jgi:hypothetical protein